MRRTLVAAAAALALGGCGSKKPAEGSGTKAVNAPPIDHRQPQAAVGKPGAVVLDLWTYLRERVYPVALNAYAPETVTAVGEENLLGGFAAVQGTVDGYAPRITRTQAVTAKRGNNERDLAVVYVTGRATAGGTTRASFLLRRSASGWSILYDSLLDTGMQGYLAGARQADPDPRTRLPADQANQAAAALSRRFQRQASRVAKGVF